jgi:serine/threonine protein phosphatase PrpC
MCIFDGHGGDKAAKRLEQIFEEVLLILENGN